MRSSARAGVARAAAKARRDRADSLPFVHLLQQLLAARAVPQHPDRDRILDAAEAEFIRHGFKRASIGEIARAAGVSRPTIYRSCGDKDSIVAGVVERRGFEFFTELSQVLEQLDSPEERAVAGFVAGVRQVRTSPLIGALREFEPDVMTDTLVVNDEALAPVALAISLVLADVGMELQAAQRATELMLRLAVSLLIRPAPLLPIETDEAAERFARTYLVPLIDAAARTQS